MGEIEQGFECAGARAGQQAPVAGRNLRAFCQLPNPHPIRALAGDHPAQSRAAPPLTVPDITQAEALQYLGALGVQSPQAEKVCVGGWGGDLRWLRQQMHRMLCNTLLEAHLQSPAPHCSCPAFTEAQLTGALSRIRACAPHPSSH